MSFLRGLYAAIVALVVTAGVILIGTIAIGLATILPLILGVLGFVALVYIVSYESIKENRKKK